jgi:hypothetical protein
MRRQSRSQIIGREGERWFESVLPPEWSIQRPLDDFGLDGIVAVGDSKHLTPYEFGVQVKSSSHFNVVRKHIVVPRIPREAIEYWARKFFPTLLVAYDTKQKLGHFEWISNLVSLGDFQSGKKSFYLHIPADRVICDECWPVIKGELERYHQEFSAALRGAREIIPMAASFAGLLRNLCTSKLANLAIRDQQILYTCAQAWTHEEVVRQLDRFIPEVDPASVAAHNLQRFRESYVAGCNLIFRDFEKSYANPDVKWIMMKNLPEAEPTLDELTAMLAECVSGLLGHISEDWKEGRSLRAAL